MENNLHPSSTDPADQAYPPVVSGPQVFQVSPEALQKPQRIAIWGSLVVLIPLFVGFVSFYYIHKHKATAQRNAQATTTAHPTTSSIQTPKDTTGTLATLGLGTFSVGPEKEIRPGVYGVSPGSEQSGNLVVTDGTGSHSVTLDNIAADPYGTNTAWVSLVNGDTIQLSGARLKNATFTPVTTHATDAPPLTTLYPGSFMVDAASSRSIHPGNLLATAPAGTNGYVLVVSSDNKIKYNAPIDSTGVPMALANGDRVGIANITSISFTPQK